MGLHLTSLDLSFDSGLYSNGNLNICSQFAVELAAEKNFICGLRMHEMQLKITENPTYSFSVTLQSTAIIPSS